MNIKFSIPQPKLFVTALEILKEFTDTVELILENKGLHITATDTAHVVLFRLELSHGVSMQYLQQRPMSREFVAGLNLKLAHQALKNCITKQDKLEVTVTDSDIKFVVASSRNSISNYNITIAQTMIQDGSRVAIEDFDQFETAAEILLPTKALENIIENLCHYDNFCINIRATSRNSYGLFFVGESELACSEIELDNQTAAIDIKTHYNLSISLSARVVKSVAKTCKISEELLLELTTNGPVKMLYSLPENCGKFEFFIAPNVQLDE